MYTVEKEFVSRNRGFDRRRILSLGLPADEEWSLLSVDTAVLTNEDLLEFCP